MKHIEHIYTGKGRQRALQLDAAKGLHFKLEGAPTGSFIEFTDDVIPMKPVKDYMGRKTLVSLPDFEGVVWLRVNADEGYLSGATGIRVTTTEFSLTKLTLTGVEAPDLLCCGELTRINARLAGINRDMRFCAAAA